MNCEWIHPLTGEIFTEETQIDAYIAELAVIKELESNLRDKRTDIEFELAQMAKAIETDSKTRRVVGKRFSVKVMLKDYKKWNTEKLDAIRQNIGDESFLKYFRIGEYKPNLQEMKKLSSTAGETAHLYKEFMDTVEITEAKPSVVIEKEV